MAEIIYRLPGREQYSYAEVKLSSDELFGPDALSSEERIALLQTALADLDQTYPAAAARTAAPAAQYNAAAPSNNPRSVCIHGDRQWKSGRSDKGPWQAFFCPQPKGSQCQAVWMKPGDPDWRNQ